MHLLTVDSRETPVSGFFHGAQTRSMPTLGDATGLRIGSEDTGKLHIEVIQLWKDLYAKLVDQQSKDRFRSSNETLSQFLKALTARCESLEGANMENQVKKFAEPVYAIIHGAKPLYDSATLLTGMESSPDALLGAINYILDSDKGSPAIRRRIIRFLLQLGQIMNEFEGYDWTSLIGETPLQRAVLSIHIKMVDHIALIFEFLDDAPCSSSMQFESLVFLDSFHAKLSSFVSMFKDTVEQFRSSISNLHFKEMRGGHSLARLKVDSNFARQGTIRTKEAINKQQRGLSDSDTFERCMSLLPDIDFHGLYRERCEGHLPGTGAWFLTSSGYQQWKTAEQTSILWVRGNPGSGKSMLSAIVITDLNNGMDPECGVAYALCQRTRQNDQTLALLLGAMIRQLSRQRNGFHEKVINECLEPNARGILDDQRLLDWLDLTTDMFRHVYLVIDALDEFQSPEELLQGLKICLRNQRLYRKLKILIFSRPTVQVDVILDLPLTIIRTENENREDIELYIKHYIPDPIHAEARALCSEKAEGMFMWVKLVFKESPMQLTQPESVLEAIRTLPQGLNGMYDLVFTELHAQAEFKRTTAFLTLNWMLRAYRPMYAKAMISALQEYKHLVDKDRSSEPVTAKSLGEFCKHLITCDQNGDLRFIHESVRVYLDQPQPQLTALQIFQEEGKKTHDIMATVCLNYLNREEFDQPLPRSFGRLGLLTTRYPLLPYAAEYWGQHAGEGQLDLHTESIFDLIGSSPRRELCMQIVLYDPDKKDKLWVFPGSTTKLHALAMFELPTIAENLWNSRGDKPLYIADGNGKTPLMYSLLSKRLKMASYLIEILPDINDKLLTKDLEASIEYACLYGWTDILSKLINRYPKWVNHPLQNGQLTPLVFALNSQREETAMELIRLGADVMQVTIDDKDFPLRVAASQGLRDAASALLEHGAFVNQQDVYGDTALHYAASNDYDSIVATLLRYGADPTKMSYESNRMPLHVAALDDGIMAIAEILKFHPEFDLGLKTTNGYSPLHMAVWGDAKRAVSTLIKMKSPLDVVDTRGRTALNLAVARGATDIAKVLITNGCEISIADIDGETPLHMAALGSHYDIIEAIFSSIPRSEWPRLIDKRNHFDGTALHLACQSGNQRSVELLISYGSDCGFGGWMGASPLHYAANFGHADLISILLRETKDPNPRDDNMSTPLHYAATAKRSSFVERLIEVCAQMDLELQTSALAQGDRTPMFNAISKGDSITAHILIPHTSPETFKNLDADNNQLIHHAAWFGAKELVQALLAYDPGLVAAKGYRNRTPLMCSIIGQRQDIFKLILSPSLSYLEDIEASGGTALLIALGFSAVEVANWLLDVKASADAVDNDSNSALHLAASAGDDKLFERILSLQQDNGCVNRYGQTVCHLVALYGTLTMLKLLVQKGFDNVKARDRFGRNAVSYAAETARLSMLDELRILGVSLQDSDDMGLVPAHAAASNGHVQVLSYLADHLCNVNAGAQDNLTPFLLAVCQGYLSTVEYILNIMPTAINDIESWNQETALITAVHTQSKTVTRLLLDAGMDQTLPDNFGYTATDLLTLWKNGKIDSFLCSQASRDSLQKRLILSCLERLMPYRELTTFREANRSNINFKRLARALRHNGDMEYANICSYPWLFEPDTTLLTFPEPCNGCQRPRIEEKIFSCKECYYDFYLCDKCHQDYIDSDRSVPEGLVKLFELEEIVRLVRLACAQENDVRIVASAVHILIPTSEFLKTTVVSYAEWEKTYPASTVYNWLERPGQKWVDLINEVIQINDKEDEIEEPERSKKLSDLQKKYSNLSRFHNPEKDISRFSCKGHDYSELLQSEYHELKKAGIYFDAQTGQPTEYLLQKIKNKYDAQAEDGTTAKNIRQDRYSDKPEQKNLDTEELKPASVESGSDKGQAPLPHIIHQVATSNTTCSSNLSEPPYVLTGRQTGHFEFVNVDAKSERLDPYSTDSSYRKIFIIEVDLDIPDVSLISAAADPSRSIPEISASSDKGVQPSAQRSIFKNQNTKTKISFGPAASIVLITSKEARSADANPEIMSLKSDNENPSALQQYNLSAEKLDLQSSSSVGSTPSISGADKEESITADQEVVLDHLVSDDPLERRAILTGLPMAEVIRPGVINDYVESLFTEADSAGYDIEQKEGKDSAISSQLKNIVDQQSDLDFSSLEIFSPENLRDQDVSHSLESIIIPELPSIKETITKPRLLVSATAKIRKTINEISCLSRQSLAKPEDDQKYPKEFIVDPPLVEAFNELLGSEQTLFDGPVLPTNHRRSNLNQAVLKCHHRMSWICLATVYLQKSLRVIDKLTILIQSDISSRLVDLLGISVQNIRQLAILFDQMTKLGNGLSEDLSIGESLVLETTRLCQQILPTFKTSAGESDISRIISNWQQMMDLLDLAIFFHTEEHKFSTISRGAVGFPFDRPFQLLSGWTCFIREASCLSDFLGASPLWICTLFDLTGDGQKALDLSLGLSVAIRTKISDFGAVWGPVYKVENEGNIIQYNAGRGCIAPWPQNRWDEYLQAIVCEDARVCHWMPFNLARESSAIELLNHASDEEQESTTSISDNSSNGRISSNNSQADRYSDIVGYEDLLPGLTNEDLLSFSQYARDSPLSFDDVLIIGASVSSRTAFSQSQCTCSLRSFEKQLQKRISTLDTRPKKVTLERAAIGVGIGYAGNGISQSHSLVPDMKCYNDRIIHWWEHERKETEPQDLRVLGGVKISICTRNAVRCSILDLFETRSIRMIVKHLRKVSHGDFAKVSDECWDIFLNGSTEDMLQFWNDKAECRGSCSDIILACLHRLRSTGIDKKRNKFNALWVPPKSIRAKRVEFDLDHHTWFHTLADGADTCAFAVLVEDCYSIMMEGECQQFCGSSRRKELRSRLQTKMIMDSTLGPFKGHKIPAGSQARDPEWQIIKLQSQRFYAHRGEYFWTREPHHRLIVVEALAYNHLMLQWAPSITEMFVSWILLNPPQGDGHKEAWDEERHTTLVHVRHSKKPGMEFDDAKETSLQKLQRLIAA